jgi:hypothetical protein
VTIYLNNDLVYNVILVIMYKLHNNIFSGNYSSNFMEIIQSILNSIHNYSVSTIKYNYD